MDKTKKTQGQEKIAQYINDLKRNSKLKKALNENLRLLDNANNLKKSIMLEDYGNELEEKYTYLDFLVEEAIKKYGTGEQKLYKIADDYGIPYEQITGLQLNALLDNKTDYQQNKDNYKDPQVSCYGDDMCSVNDDFDYFLNDVYPAHPPITLNIRKQCDLRAYPISIGIHKYASKRDVLDFVNKRWDVIKEKIENYTDEKKRFRKRKLDQKIVDFIYDNKNIPAKELADQVSEKFGKDFIYYEISKIISLERYRRSEK